jgi:hypothetical protein
MAGARGHVFDRDKELMMAETPPERFKPLDEWTPDDHLEHRRSAG